MERPTIDIGAYRAREPEHQCLASLMAPVPAGVGSALEVGAREGFISRHLAGCVPAVTALDLQCPNVDHARVNRVQGDATHHQFADAAFGLVLCAEVLEHVPRTDFVGQTAPPTNALSAWLLGRAGNLWAAYDQEVPCMKCGCKFGPPPSRTPLQSLNSRAAAVLRDRLNRGWQPHGSRLHMLLKRDVV